MERFHTKKFEKDLPNYRVSALEEREYTYIGTNLWENPPLPVYKDLSSANLLPYENSYQRTYDHFINSDFIVNDPRFPKILVTQHHHRLLFECQKGLLPIAKRAIINIDAHDDFYMKGNVKRKEVTIGNWGVAGADLNYWQDFVHLYPSYPYPYGKYLHLADGSISLWRNSSKANYSFSQFLGPDWQNANNLKCFYNNGKYILSIDADTVALVDEPINKKVLTTIGNLIESVKDDPSLELIHFSLSPTHCSSQNAEYVWNYLRRGLLGKGVFKNL